MRSQPTRKTSASKVCRNSKKNDGVDTDRHSPEDIPEMRVSLINKTITSGPFTDQPAGKLTKMTNVKGSSHMKGRVSKKSINPC